MRSKKGAIEVQFNWIFVLIVGALILVFFINISNIQRKNADKKLAFELLSKMDLIMSGAMTIPKTGQIFQMPGVSFGLDCNSISSLGVTRQFPERIVFGPDLLKGKQLIIASEDWTAPFKVANFLYMTTSDVRYVVVSYNGTENEENANAFLNSLPDNITKEIYFINDQGGYNQIINLNDQNNYKVKLIFSSKFSLVTFESLKQINLSDYLTKLPQNAVTGIYFDDLSTISTVRFLEKEENHLTMTGADYIQVYKEPMIFGAIFSENKDEFFCSLEKAFKRLHYVAEVYSTKEGQLSYDYNNVYTDRTECWSGTTRAVTEIEKISQFAIIKDIGGITSSEDIVSVANEYAVRSSCAPVY